MARTLLFLLILGLAHPATARMYQWVDPETGTTQLSGKPPAWYRSEEGGPRVFVFNNGRVVDDTGIEVSDVERERLRQQALVNAERNREEAREKMLEAKRMEALLDKERQQEQEEEIVDYTPEESETSEEETPEQAPQEQREMTTEAMRELIREWERRQTQQARETIGREGPARGADSPPSPPPEEPPPPRPLE